jgi:hypothetical protein
MISRYNSGGSNDKGNDILGFYFWRKTFFSSIKPIMVGAMMPIKYGIHVLTSEK